MPRKIPHPRLLASLFVVAMLAWVAWSAIPFDVRAVNPMPTALPLADLTITESVPPHGFIDVRADVDDAGQPLGVTSVFLRFSEPVQLEASQVTVLSTSALAPAVIALQGYDNEWILALDRPPAGGASTAIVLFDGALYLLFHSHPGDVNLDGVTNEGDLDLLTAAIAAGSVTVESHDIDRSDVVDDFDRQRLQSLLAAGYDGRIWSSNLTPPRVVCCCAGGYCNIHIGDGCQDEDTETGCPCVPNPCLPNGGPG